MMFVIGYLKALKSEWMNRLQAQVLWKDLQISLYE